MEKSVNSHNIDYTVIKNFWKALEADWALFRGSVIQANGRLAFEDGLRYGGLLHCASHGTSVRTILADIMDTLKKFKVLCCPSKAVGC